MCASLRPRPIAPHLMNRSRSGRCRTIRTAISVECTTVAARLRRGGGTAMQDGAHLPLADWEPQYGINGEIRQQLADVGVFAGLHEHDDLRLRRRGLQGAPGDVQIRHRVARVVVAPAIDELPDEKIGRLRVNGPVQVTGEVEPPPPRLSAAGAERRNRRGSGRDSGRDGASLRVLITAGLC